MLCVQISYWGHIMCSVAGLASTSYRPVVGNYRHSIQQSSHSFCPASHTYTFSINIMIVSVQRVEVLLATVQITADMPAYTISDI